MSHEAKPNAGYNWADPHHFHGDHDDQDGHGGHHVTSWQLLVSILLLLLFFTGLTIFSAEAERWAIGLGIPISHFWNVMIALSIALVKSIFVCMFFMHLKNDNPLNTMILLTTLFVFGLFILFTGIDLNERDAINEFKAELIVAGGTGTGMAPGGGNFGQTITNSVKQRHIDEIAEKIAAKHQHLDEKGEPAPTDDDIHQAEQEFWNVFYHHKLEDHPEHVPDRHGYDTNDRHAKWKANHIETHGDHNVSTASKSVSRHGLTPGLFDAETNHGGEPGAHGDQPETHETEALNDDQNADKPATPEEDH